MMKALGMALVMMGMMVAGRGVADETSEPAAQPVQVVQTLVATSLEVALQRYAAAANCRVERVSGVTARVLLPASDTHSPAELVAAITKELAAHNIALFKIGEQRLVATWLDPTRAPISNARQAAIAELLEIPPSEGARPAAAE